MATREIPRDEWREFCDTFSRMHQGWLADVQVLGTEPNRRFEAKGLPFRGVTFDTKGTGKNEVSIFIDQRPEDDLTHTVSEPTHIRLDTSDRGVEEGFEVDAEDGTTAIVRFDSRQ